MILGPKTTLLLHNSKEFMTAVRNIITGNIESMSGSFNVDMTKRMFHVGRTTVNFTTTCTVGNCTTVFKQFVGDGFWDPNFINEKFGRQIGPNIPDGKGPNLEFFGTPYDYVPTFWKIVIFPKNRNI